MTSIKTTNNSAATQVFDFTSLDVVYGAAKNSVYTVAPMLATMILKAYSAVITDEETGEEAYPAWDAQQAALTSVAVTMVLSTVIKQLAQGALMDVESVEDAARIQYGRILEANPDVQLVNSGMMDVVSVMYMVGILEVTTDDERCDEANEYLVPSRMAYNNFFKVSALVPQYQPIKTVTDRRTRQTSASSKKDHLASLSIIKGGRAKPNSKLKTAIDFLQTQPFMLDAEQLEVINALYRIERLKDDVTIKSNQFVVDACNTIDSAEYLYSEHGTCKRGRIMPLCFGAPNLQSGDLCRSLYNVVSTQPVMSDHIGVTYFKNEMKEAAGFPLDMKVIRTINQDPVEFLRLCLLNQVQCDEPFKLVKMCRELVNAQTAWAKGEGYIFSTPVGLDAKSSGTQILAILAGDAEIADRCGVTNVLRTEKERKLVDMYAYSGQLVNAATGYTFNRNDMKTPYMAIQYGGSWKAIYKQAKFKMTCANQGLFSSDEVEEMAKKCADIVKKSLGNNINGLIASIEHNVHKMCEDQNIESFSYKHVDGFMVTVNDKKQVNAGWAGEINTAVRGDLIAKAVKFGEVNPETQVGSWMVTVDSDRAEFVRKFVVHFVQGIDAMLARTVAVNAKEAGIEGYATIHDCFRTCVADADKLLPLIQNAYLELFTGGKIMANLEAQIGKLTGYIDSDSCFVPYQVAKPIDASMYVMPNNYYFC